MCSSDLSLLNSFYAEDTILAKSIAERLINNYPNNLALRQFLPFVYYISRDLDRTIKAIDYLSENYPDNYDVQRNCAYLSFKCYWVSRSASILDKAKWYLNKANKLNPPKIETYEELLEETKS